MWIDRIVTETDDGSDLIELHERLTVLSSHDDARRRATYERIYQALRGVKGSHLEVRTGNGDGVIALRPIEIDPTLVDAVTDEIIPADRLGRLGIVGQLNDAEAMSKHLRSLHVTSDAMVRRLSSDRDMINLAQTPLDQVWTLAKAIQDDMETLEHVSRQGAGISAAAAERDAAEAEFGTIMAERAEVAELNKKLLAGAGAAVLLAVVLAVFVHLYAGALFGVAALGIGAFAVYKVQNGEFTDRHEAVTEQYGGSELSIALERVDELFDSHKIGRKQKEAQENLNRSMAEWRKLAGTADPDALIRERPRLEELAGHLRIIENEAAPGATQQDYEILVGFASLLAELTRRFQMERVPLLVDDLFGTVHPDLHNVLRELIARAASRRQVILESSDEHVARWAAAEVVTGNALLFTDQDVELPTASASAEPAADTPESV